MRGEEKVLQQVRREKKTERVPAATELFEQLRALRKELAARDHIPPYLIFSDATLRDMCAVKPETLEDMKNVKGIGDFKLKKYGKAFLECLAAE